MFSVLNSINVVSSVTVLVWSIRTLFVYGTGGTLRLNSVNSELRTVVTQLLSSGKHNEQNTLSKKNCSFDHTNYNEVNIN